MRNENFKQLIVNDAVRAAYGVDDPFDENRRLAREDARLDALARGRLATTEVQSAAPAPAA